MDLEALTRKLNFITGAKAWDDDFVDRMNSWWSCVILIAFAIIVSARQYVGTPIKCWFPQEFHKSWRQYSENYCWIKNTYFVPPDQDLPKDFDIRRHNELAYYQWVPYVLMCLAFLFYVPKAVWRLCNWQTGINVQTIVTMACDSSNIKPDQREKTMNALANHLDDVITRIEQTDNVLKRIQQFGSCLAPRARLGRHLTSLYLFVKVLYLLNIILQFFILKSFIGTQYHFYGIRMLSDIMSGHEWESSGHFPRVTMCDFSVRALGQGSHNYTIQCVLMVNLFNEKVFILLWFWYILMVVVTSYNLIRWACNIMRFNLRMQLVRNYLTMTRPKDEIGVSERDLHDFVAHNLQMDGAFLLRLIQSNAGDIIAANLARAMWKRFQSKEDPKKQLTPSKGYESPDGLSEALV